MSAKAIWGFEEILIGTVTLAFGRGCGWGFGCIAYLRLLDQLRLRAAPVHSLAQAGCLQKRGVGRRVSFCGLAGPWSAHGQSLAGVAMVVAGMSVAFWLTVLLLAIGKLDGHLAGLRRCSAKKWTGGRGASVPHAAQRDLRGQLLRWPGVRADFYLVRLSTWAAHLCLQPEGGKPGAPHLR